MLTHRRWWRIRRWLIIGCGIATLAVAARLPAVVAQLRQDRISEALYWRGGQLQLEGHLDEAAAAFRASIAASPRATGAYIALADVEFIQGHTDEAVVAHRQLMTRYPYSSTPELYRQVGLIELRGGKVEAATRDLLQAITIDPEDWLAFHWLGHAYDRLGDRAAARAAWTRAVTLNPKFEPARVQLRRLDANHP